MRVIVTGAGGTVGQALLAHWRATAPELEVQGWDRNAVPPHDAAATERFVRERAPDAIVHLAVPSRPTGVADEGRLVSVAWSERLARLCAELGARLVFTSTAMVFTDDAKGPFTLESEPDATEGYGGEKREAERRVLDANADAIVARIGWQIGAAPGGNQMVDHLARTAAEQGTIKASRAWYPACSFVDDTAAALARLVAGDPAVPRGLCQLDANTGWTFFDIARALAALPERGWTVEPDDAFVYDQRLIDPRVGLPPLDRRLPGLPPAHIMP